MVTKIYEQNLKVLRGIVDALPFDKESKEEIMQYAEDPTVFLNEQSKKLLEDNKENVVDYRITLPYEGYSSRGDSDLFTAATNLLMDLLLDEDDRESASNITKDVFYTGKFTKGKSTRKVWKFINSKSSFIAKKIVSLVEEAIEYQHIDKNKMEYIDFSLESFEVYNIAYISRHLKRYVLLKGGFSNSICKSFLDLIEKDENFTFIVKSDFCKKDLEKKVEKGVKVLLTKLQELISAEIIKDTQGTKKLYISFNIFDYFCASSGEDWDSCLSIQSGMNYGLGLLALVKCPDTAMLIVSDEKDEMKSVLGLKTPSVISRSWMFYGEKEHYILVKWYPMNLNKTINYSKLRDEGIDIVPSRELEEYENGFSSWVPCTFENKQIAWIYTDCYTINLIPDEGEIKAKLRFNSSSGFQQLSYDREKKKGGIYHSSFFLTERILGEHYLNIESYLNDCLYDPERKNNIIWDEKDNCERSKLFILGDGESKFPSGTNLTYDLEGNIVEDTLGIRRSLVDYMDRENYGVCENCGETYDVDSLFQLASGGFICEGCYDNGDYRTCTNCEGVFYYDELTCVDDEFYCESCIDDICSTCDECMELFHDRDVVYTEDGRTVCNSCYEERYDRCENCGTEIYIDDDSGEYTDEGYICENCLLIHRQLQEALEEAEERREQESSEELIID